MKNLLSDGILATPPSFVRGILKAASDPNVISFASGLPNPASFPQEALRQSMQRIVDAYGSKVFQYSVTAGLQAVPRPLRRNEGYETRLQYIGIRSFGM